MASGKIKVDSYKFLGEYPDCDGSKHISYPSEYSEMLIYAQPTQSGNWIPIIVHRDLPKPTTLVNAGWYRSTSDNRAVSIKFETDYFCVPASTNNSGNGGYTKLLVYYK